MSVRKNRHMQLSSEKARHIILNTFQRYNLPLCTLQINSHVFEDLRLNLGMDKKTSKKKKQLIKINYYIKQFINTSFEKNKTLVNNHSQTSKDDEIYKTEEIIANEKAVNLTIQQSDNNANKSNLSELSKSEGNGKTKARKNKRSVEKYIIRVDNTVNDTDRIDHNEESNEVEKVEANKFDLSEKLEDDTKVENENEETKNQKEYNSDNDNSVKNDGIKENQRVCNSDPDSRTKNNEKEEVTNQIFNCCDSNLDQIDVSASTKCEQNRDRAKKRNSEIEKTNNINVIIPDDDDDQLKDISKAKDNEKNDIVLVEIDEVNHSENLKINKKNESENEETKNKTVYNSDSVVDYNISSPCSAAHDELELEVQINLPNVSVPIAQNISILSDSKQDDIINTQVLQDLDNHSENHQLYKKCSAKNNEKEEATNQIVNCCDSIDVSASTKCEQNSDRAKKRNSEIEKTNNINVIIPDDDDDQLKHISKVKDNEKYDIEIDKLFHSENLKINKNNEIKNEETKNKTEYNSDGDVDYSISSPCSAAHDEIELEAQKKHHDVSVPIAHNISILSDSKQDDIINTPVLQDLDSVPFNDQSARNNRDKKLGWNLAGFMPTGLTFTWTREQLDEIISKESKKLATYDEAHKTRKNAKTLDEAEDITSYHDLVRDVHPTCEMYIHQTYYKPPEKPMQKRTITIRTFCMFQECKRFICKAKFRNNDSEDITFHILEDMKSMNHSDPMAPQIRAKNRISCFKQTRHDTPLDFKRKAIMKYANNPKRIATKNLGNATTDETIRKLYEAAKSRFREDQNHFISLQKMSDKPGTFIWFLSYKPFILIILTEEMVDTVLQAVKLYGPLDWYFDATGSYFRDARNFPNNSQLFMYSLMTRFASNARNDKLMTFPLAIVFTTAHNTKNIELFISTILNVIERKSSKQYYEIFRVITTDFAMSNINALTRVFNQLTVVQYLNKCHEIINSLQNDINFPINIVVIKLCSSHLSKLYENAVRKFFEKNDHTGFVCSEILKSLYDIHNIDEIYKLLKKLWQYLLAENDQERNVTYNDLNAYKFSITGKKLDGRPKNVIVEDNIFSVNVDVSLETETEPDEQTNELFDSETIYGNSPFYKRAYLDYKSVLKKSNSDLELFEKRICDFILYVIRRYITYLPLFTSFLTFKQYYGMNKEENDIANHANNGVIEAHHKNTKQDIKSMERLVGKPPIRLDDYINYVFKKDVEAKIALFKLNIPNSKVTRNCRSTEKKKNNTTPSRKRKSKSLEPTPAKVRKISTPSVSNSQMMSKMRISDIKNTRETFVKRIQPISQTNLSGSSKKINRKLFSPNRPNDIISSISDVTKTPIAASTPLHELISKKNVLINKAKAPSNSGILSIESTVSALEVIPEEQSEQILTQNDTKIPVAASTPVHGKHKLTVPITSDTAVIENIICASEGVSEKQKEHSKTDNKSCTATESDLRYFTSNSSAFCGFSYRVQNNYLISNINYYTTPRNENCNNLNVAVKNQNTLNFQEIYCLSKNNYTEKLLNFLIDFSMLIFLSIHKKSTSILQLSDSDILLGLLEPSKEQDVVKYRKKQIIKIITDNFKSDQIIIPILRSQHYVCIIIDQNANTICLLDSLLLNDERRIMISTRNYKEMFINNISDMLNDCHGVYDGFIDKMISLESIYRKSNCQTDYYNCGVFLLNNVEKILQGANNLYDSTFNPTTYRKHLLATIIIHSDSVLNICPQCSVIEKSFYEINPSSHQSFLDFSIKDWIECIHCKRFWHTSCATRTHGSNNMSSFTCLMCA